MAAFSAVDIWEDTPDEGLGSHYSSYFVALACVGVIAYVVCAWGGAWATPGVAALLLVFGPWVVVRAHVKELEVARALGLLKAYEGPPAPGRPI